MASIYLGNLSWALDEDTLAAEISKTAAPTNLEIMRHKSGRSLGYGLAQFETAEEAQAVIEALHGVEIDGRPVNCREDRGPRAKPAPAPAPAALSNRVFVGNLSWDTGDDVLLDIFSDFNIVAANVQFQSSGSSKGWALLEFGSADDAAAAIEAMNGAELDGREILCRPDRGAPQRRDAAPRRQPRERRVLAEGLPSPSVFIGNLSWEVNDSGLEELLSGYSVEEASVQTRPDGKSRGYALVRFADVEEAQRAITDLNGQDLIGRKLLVKFDAK